MEDQLAVLISCLEDKHINYECWIYLQHSHTQKPLLLSFSRFIPPHWTIPDNFGILLLIVLQMAKVKQTHSQIKAHYPLYINTHPLINKLSWAIHISPKHQDSTPDAIQPPHVSWVVPHNSHGAPSPLKELLLPFEHLTGPAVEPDYF